MADISEKKSVYWSESDKTLLRTLWAAGIPTPQIADQLKRTPTAVSVMATRLQLPRRGKEREEQSVQKKRRCLTCRTEFTPRYITVFICKSCKAKPGWDDGALIAEHSIAGRDVS